MPILYSFRRCPYAMRARMALAWSGIGVELREVLLRDKPASLLALSPKATVPVLIAEKEGVLDESLDIMLWALLRHTPRTCALGGGVADQGALIEEFDQGFKPPLDQYKYHSSDSQQPASYFRDQCAEWLHRLDTALARQAYLLGSEPQLLDMALLPFIRQFAHVDRAWFANAPYKNLQRWLHAWLEHELFTSIMGKYQPWQEGTEGVAWLPQLSVVTN
ncbi:MAG TPA: glutathione S-transferase [Gammaproteobacteria bacterium]|nr:glutathione S-transferase [Gammaproteobacteria bacterium]